jgi:hypothetical protein
MSTTRELLSAASEAARRAAQLDASGAADGARESYAAAVAALLPLLQPSPPPQLLLPPQQQAELRARATEYMNRIEALDRRPAAPPPVVVVEATYSSEEAEADTLEALLVSEALVRIKSGATVRSRAVSQLALPADACRPQVGAEGGAGEGVGDAGGGGDGGGDEAAAAETRLRRRRYHVAQELLQTEASYVRQLVGRAAVLPMVLVAATE